MAFLFCVEVASKTDDRPQPYAVSQRAPVSGPNPCEDSLGADMFVSLRGGKRNEVTVDPLGVSELPTESPANGEV